MIAAVTGLAVRITLLVGGSVVLAVHTGSLWLVALGPIVAALMFWLESGGNRRDAILFERHPWAFSTGMAVVLGVTAGSMVGALEHSARSGLWFGCVSGALWLFAYRYSTGPKIVASSQRLVR
jgi:hypothetical protein